MIKPKTEEAVRIMVEEEQQLDLIDDRRVANFCGAASKAIQLLLEEIKDIGRR